MLSREFMRTVSLGAQLGPTYAYMNGDERNTTVAQRNSFRMEVDGRGPGLRGGLGIGIGRAVESTGGAGLWPGYGLIEVIRS